MWSRFQLGGGVQAEKAAETNQATENEDEGVSGLKRWLSNLKNNSAYSIRM